tara:strand:- start:531 stop:635 length:105 start_codon:yes stop_codon:yes gene_type:complete
MVLLWEKAAMAVKVAARVKLAALQFKTHQQMFQS